MKSIRTLALFLTFLAASGCFGKGHSGFVYHDGGGSGGALSATVSGGGLVLMDPGAATFLLGVIILANTLPIGTADGDIVFRLGATSEVAPDTTEVRLAPGETRQVPISALAVTAAIVTLVVIAELVVSGITRTFNVAWTNAAANSAAYFLLSQFGNPQLASLWFASAILAPLAVLACHSSAAVPKKIPSARTEIRAYGAALIVFTLVQLALTFAGVDDGGGEAFPDGQGTHGYTVKAEPSAALAAGDYCTFWLSVSESIPISDPARHYQYAFVMDSDGNVGNNYTPAAGFPNDFFGGTDRWYELNYTPTTGWLVTCKVIGAGNSVTVVPSSARMIIREDSIVLFVPRSEFVLEKPPFRATSFCHNGDFGINPPHDWGGDPTPTVPEALHAWQ